MKNINTINSLSLGLLDAGGEVFTNFPGYMSHKLFSSLGGKITSVNEKTAYEVAWGSSFAGKRAAVMFKNVGFDDAADPFLNSMVVGVNAGMVLVVFDDVFVEGSQSRQDSRHYFDFFKGLWFEPYSVQNAYDIAYKAFSLSERFQIPVVIRVTNQLVNLNGKCKRKPKQKKTYPLIKNHKRFVVHPVNSKYQRAVLAKKNTRIQKYIDSFYKGMIGGNSVESAKTVVTFGCCLTEEKDYIKRGYNKIQIYSYPFPNFLTDIVQKSSNVAILEQGDNFAHRKIQEQMANALNLESNTGFVPDKSNGYIISSNYEKLYSALRKIRPTCLIGDLGEYTKDTLDSIDGVLCFGSSISVGLGCLLAGKKNVFSIIGDAAYLHSGKNSIVEAIERNLPIKAVVICNGGSQGTGGQIIPGDLYYQPNGVEVCYLEYKKSSEPDFEKALKKIVNTKTVSILYIQM